MIYTFLGLASRSDLKGLEQQMVRMNMKLAEVSTALVGLSDQLVKARDEIVGKIAELEAELADVDVPAEAEAALESLKEAAQSLDDLVPDA